MAIRTLRLAGLLAFALSFNPANTQHYAPGDNGAMIKICTSTGFYYISENELLGDDDKKPDPAPTACHAVCASERQKCIPKSARQK
ncbi:hypothetical protein [Parvularcula sp. IMCC14364]|uniref:hypothetical protein n=1 Tax=Parvularcula sp. IMCC14364 TaxID=3067902 RepID=UPI002741BB9C|nr:hypothetical protein [Parvularcula sp. IMCC14364]